MLLKGEGVEIDVNRAIDLFNSASESGNPYSHYNLGVILYDDKIAPKDYERSLVHLERAAMRGIVPAMQNIGLMYAKGEGTEKSYQDAYVWLNIAKHFGETDLESVIEIIYSQLEDQEIESANQRIFELIDRLEVIKKIRFDIVEFAEAFR